LDEQLLSIESKLLFKESHFPRLREYLLNAGGLREWFIYYQGANQWNKRFYEQQLFLLLGQELLSAGIYPDGKMQLTGYRLDEVARVQRDFDYDENDPTQLVLCGATIHLKHSSLKNRPEALAFKRPLASEQGDPEGFERLMSLLV